MKLSDILKKRDGLAQQADKLRGEIAAKRAAMASEILEGGDPAVLSRQINDLETQLEGVEAARKSANVTAGALTQEQAEADKTARLATLRADEEAAYQAAVKALVVLNDKLGNLKDVYHQLQLAGEHPRAGFSPALYSALKAAIDRVGSVTPELVGLPPKPTAKEVRKQAAKNEVERAKELVATMRKAYDQSGGESYVKRNLEGAEAALRAAEARAKS